MSEYQDFLFELGTEELPPKSLLSLSQALGREVSNALEKAKLKHGEISLYAAPRRLALLIRDLQTKQEDQQNLRKGPAEKAAFDDDGNPTKAVIGFARSCGVEVDQLERIDTPKGVWMGYTVATQGADSATLLPELMQGALDQLPIPKRMRWGALDAEFLRPVHWVAALFGNDVVPMTLYGASSENRTYGHRFHHPAPITLTTPTEYVTTLEQCGYVLADFEARKAELHKQITATAATLNGNALIDPALLDEVTALVEWPVAISGTFESRFLEVPQEALIASMQGHQKFFPVVDDDGQLMAHFITISNIESRDPSMVQHGNERVIRPRLSDAAFFWEQDRKHPLSSHQPGLAKVVYQDKLGSLQDKSGRVAQLAGTIAEALGANSDHARRAAELGKCDLLTHMVKEFPELQGVMGRYYAIHDGEPDAVAVALDEQYMPRFSGDTLPGSLIGESLALAERIDTLVGIFGIGMIPTGDKDPFALRRAALGVLRILIENRRSLDLYSLINTACDAYGEAITAEASEQVFNFVMERLRSYYSEQNIHVSLYESVLACQPHRPLDFDMRIHAVESFVSQPEAESLSAANKRIHNLLKKSDEAIPEQIDPTLFEQTAESDLADALDKIRSGLDQALASDDYETALISLATLQQPVDTFFDAVMVMTEDDSVRHNRLALLAQLRTQFLRIADISHLHTT